MQAISSKKTSPKRRKVIMCFVLLLVIIGGGAAAYAYSKYQEQKVADAHRDANTVQEEQTEDNAGKKTQTPPKPGQTEPEQPTPQPQPETPAVQPEKPTIERAGGDPVIKVVATFQTASEGRCDLKLSKEGQVSQTFSAPVVIGASYYSCSFSIQRSSLPVSGPWNAIVSHVIGDKATDSELKEVQ